jgi:3-phosphoshikimate 1-carboxyvinyltransferase
MSTIRVEPDSPLRGRVRLPGDKSIAHRAAILAALAVGENRLSNAPTGEDWQATVRCLRALGVELQINGETAVVRSKGPDAWREPIGDLDCGASGTTMRLMAGALAGRPFFARLTGTPGLLRRPMARVAEPLRAMGAEVRLSPSRTGPIEIRGGALRPIDWKTPVSSAQVKSAILFAAASARGETRVTEPSVSRDHTERMMAHLGAAIRCEGTAVRLRGPWSPPPFALAIPGDFSSAAFLWGAAAIAPGSAITVEEVGLNPTRAGFLSVLQKMGADIRSEARGDSSGEPVGDVTVTYAGRLHGTEISGSLTLLSLDEIPLLAVLAAFAEGDTVSRDAAELRVKESDRLQSVANGLAALGVGVEMSDDGLMVHGGEVRGGRINAKDDHRIAMAFAVAGLAASGPVTIDSAEEVNKSFPEFFATMKQLGAETT